MDCTKVVEDLRGNGNSAAISFFGLPRYCGWYHPVSACIGYCAVSFQSCELLLRSLDNDPQLSLLIKLLTIPTDTRLFAMNAFNNQCRNLIQILLENAPISLTCESR